MTRPSHPKKEIETAIRYAESQGWQVTVGGGFVAQIQPCGGELGSWVN
jgi:hypothetical protein